MGHYAHIAALFFALTACAAQEPGNRSSHEPVVSACTQLIMDYALYRDQGNGRALVDLFTADAQLLMNGTIFSGHDELLARVTNAEAAPYLTHLMSTVRIFPESVDQARGLSYVSVYVGEPGAAQQQQARLAAVGEYRDQFVRTAQGWKIARREFVPRVNFAKPAANKRESP